MDKIYLARPSLELERAFYEMNEELHGQSQFREYDTFSGLLQKLAADEQQPDNPAYVPMSVFWLVNDESRILGELRFRHYLNESLEQEGGHIGYHIRPSERGKGYGTAILRLMLARLREQNFPRVLVTCDTDNLASARIIERNGGIFHSHGISAWTGNPISRYWIDLA